MNYKLLDKAYKLGKLRNVSLLNGYYVSKDFNTIYLQNHFGDGGILVTIDNSDYVEAFDYGAFHRLVFTNAPYEYDIVPLR